MLIINFSFVKRNVHNTANSTKFKLSPTLAKLIIYRYYPANFIRPKTKKRRQKKLETCYY